MPSLYFRGIQRPFFSSISASLSLSLSLSLLSFLLFVSARPLAGVSQFSVLEFFVPSCLLSLSSSLSFLPLPPPAPLSSPIFGVGPFRTPQMSCAPIDSISDAQFGLRKRARVLDHSKRDTSSRQFYITYFSLNKIIYTHTYIHFNNI